MFETEEFHGEQIMSRYGYKECPVCGSSEIKTTRRVKSGQVYRIYICDECKSIIKREFEK